MLRWLDIKSYIIHYIHHCNFIQDGSFRGCLRMWGSKKLPSPKICHKHPTMMKLSTCLPYLKKIQKNIWIMWQIKKYYIKKYIYRFCFGTLFLFILTLFKSFKIALISVVTILMMSAKFATLSLLKIRIFWNKGYDLIIFVHNVTNKIFLCTLNSIVYEMKVWYHYHF